MKSSSSTTGGRVLSRITSAADGRFSFVVVRAIEEDVDDDVRTSELRRAAYDSDEYARWIESIADEREHLTKSAYGKRGFETTGGEEGELIVPDSLLDCMMTTMCTDRSLPDLAADRLST